MKTRKRIIGRDKGTIWFFRRNRAGNFVPAPDPKCPEGFAVGKDANEVLRDLQGGLYDGNPAGDHYIACECRYVRLKRS